MALLIGTVAVAILLTIAAMIVYDRTRSLRSDKYEEHKDAHMEAITEYRIRRNLNQGG